MLQEISIDSIELDPFATIGKDTMLITATSAKGWNTMTASWGGMGHLWNRDVMFIFVRKSRYTHSFLEEGSRFTCSFFPEEQKRALGYLGSHSGRDGDKVKASGLNAEALDDGGISFKEANLVFAQPFDEQPVHNTGRLRPVAALRRRIGNQECLSAF